MTTRKYWASKISPNVIRKVTCTRETESSVWIIHPATGEEVRRQKKDSWKGSYYDTWKEAQEASLAVVQNTIGSLEDRLSQARKQYSKIAAMTEEDCTEA